MDHVNIQKGFTLIELIIIIFIISLFSGMSLATYNTFNETKKLEADTKKFESTIEYVKKIAIAGQTYPACTDPLTNYGVTFTSNSYSVYAKCGSNMTLFTNTLASNDTFSAIPVDILFKVGGIGAESTPQPVIIRNASRLQCFTLIISISGAITENGPTSCS